jgi:hypothetical protein
VTDSNEERTQDREEERRQEREAARIWDRLGSAMGAAGELGEAIAQRNLDLWNRVAANLSKAKYTGDELADDATQAVTVAMRNLRDVWTVVAFPPVGGGVATELPSRSLFLQPDPSEPPRVDRDWWGYMVSEDVQAIPVPPPVFEGRSIVTIRLAGADSDTCCRLEKFLRAQYSSTDTAVALLAQDVTQLTVERPLVEGVYHGVAYVDADTTPRAIAHLWIVVEPPPARRESR